MPSPNYFDWPTSRFSFDPYFGNRVKSIIEWEVTTEAIEKGFWRFKRKYYKATATAAPQKSPRQASALVVEYGETPQEAIDNVKSQINKIISNYDDYLKYKEFKTTKLKLE